MRRSEIVEMIKRTTKKAISERANSDTDKYTEEQAKDAKGDVKKNKASEIIINPEIPSIVQNR